MLPDDEIKVATPSDMDVATLIELPGNSINVAKVATPSDTDVATLTAIHLLNGSGGQTINEILRDPDPIRRQERLMAHLEALADLASQEELLLTGRTA